MKKDLIRQAAQALAEADALLVGAGAGMGVDSGLPDFRGDKGFWKAYPPFEKLGYSFIDMANPVWFEEDPRLAWGFYGHRLNLYRETTCTFRPPIPNAFTAARRGATVFFSQLSGVSGT